MSGGNTPGSGTPDPREAKEPPDFASHPQEAYNFVCSVLEESIAAKEKYKAKYAGSSAQNKKLRSIVHEKIEQIEALESTFSAEGFDNGSRQQGKLKSRCPQGWTRESWKLSRSSPPFDWLRELVGVLCRVVVAASQGLVVDEAEVEVRDLHLLPKTLGRVNLKLVGVVCPTRRRFNSEKIGSFAINVGSGANTGQTNLSSLLPSSRN